MSGIDLFSKRKSIRAFTDKPVPRNVLEAILSDAAQAPSWANTQPWEVVVAQGARLKSLGDALCVHLADHDPQNPDLPMPSHSWPAPFNKRITSLGKALFERVNIRQDDKEARMAHYERMYRCFGAPHLVMFLLDEKLTLPYPLHDIGAYVQTMCLAAEARDIGTCILAAMARYPDTVRKILDITSNKKVILGVALGYKDKRSPYNTFKSTREPLDVFVKWIGRANA